MQKMIKGTLIQALACSEVIHLDIDRIYEQQAIQYYIAYRHSEFYEAEFFDYHSPRIYSYLERVTGIYCEELAGNNYHHMYKLIKKGYSNIYKLMTHHSIITAEKVKKVLHSKGATGRDIAFRSSVLLFLYEQESNKRNIQLIINTEGLMSFIQMYHSDLEIEVHNYYKLQPPFNLKMPVDDYPESEPLNELFTSSFTFTEYIEYLKNKDRQTFEKDPNKQSLDAFMTDQDKLFRMGGDSGLYFLYHALLSYFGISSNTYLKEFSQREIKIINHLIQSITSNYNIQLPKESMITPILFMFSISKDFNFLKQAIKKSSFEYHLYLNESTWTNEMLQKEERIQSLQEENQLLKQQLQVEKELNNASNIQIKERQKESERLQAELTKKSKSEPELIALREFVFEAMTNYVEEKLPDEVIINEKIKQLNEKELVVFGGDERWIEKMKSVLPNAIFYTAEVAKNRSLKQIQSVDYIIFNTAKNSHSVYNKVMSMIQPQQRVIFIDGNYSIQKSIAMIYDTF